MPPRSSWKGYLRLSLVSMPIKAYSAAATGGEIRLSQLHRECASPIKHRKVCPLHGAVDSGDITSGYQYAKGQYVVIEAEELKQLRTESDKAVTIDGFVSVEALDPVYFAGKSYYLVPDGPVAQKAYRLLHRVMEERGLFAIGRVVLAGKEKLAVLGPMSRLLVLSTLSYESQLKQPSAFEDELAEVEFSQEEVELTERLIERSTFGGFDISGYKNTYTEKLTELIEAKVMGREIVTAPPAEEPKVLELMEALKRSVAEAEARDVAGRTTAKAKKKMAPSTRKKRAPKRRKKSS